MNQIIRKLINEGNYSPAMKASLLFFAENTVATNCNNVLKSFNTDTNGIKAESLTVITDYIQCILDDNILETEEMNTLLALKRFFRIHEGDFLKFKRHEAIKQILSEQLRRIYLDNKVDKSEACMKVDLQALFGLSYDEFLSFEQEAVEEALKSGAELSNLDTFYRI